MTTTSPSPTFEQARRDNLGTRLVLVLLALICLVFTPSIVFLFAIPLGTYGPRAALLGVTLGVAAFLLVWRALMVRFALEAAGRLTLRDGTMAFGTRYLVHVPYDRVRALQVSDALGTVRDRQSTDQGANTLHIEGPGLRKRLLLGAEQARAAQEALAARCPGAIVIDAQGGLRPASGHWSRSHREAARTFYSQRQRRMLALAIFGLGIGGLGLVASWSAPQAATAVSPLCGIGTYGLIELLRLRRLAAALPAATEA